MGFKGASVPFVRSLRDNTVFIHNRNKHRILGDHFPANEAFDLLLELLGVKIWSREILVYRDNDPGH